MANSKDRRQMDSEKAILERIRARLKSKEHFDEVYTLSAHEENKRNVRLSTGDTDITNTVRLLDEGTVVDVAGRPMFYIMKGSIEKWYNNLSGDFVGAINYGHNPRSTDPVPIGEWTKADLKVVDIGEGRKGLDVNVRLFDNLHRVQDLKATSFPLGVSVEMDTQWNEKESRKAQMEMIDDIEITEFAIVGECGNVRSHGLYLSGGKEDLSLKDKYKRFFEKEEVEQEEKELAVEETEQEEPEEVVEEPAQVEDAEVTAEALAEMRAELEEAKEILSRMMGVVEGLEKDNEELNKKLTVEVDKNKKLSENVFDRGKDLVKKYSDENKRKNMSADKENQYDEDNAAWGRVF